MRAVLESLAVVDPAVALAASREPDTEMPTRVHARARQRGVDVCFVSNGSARRTVTLGGDRPGDVVGVELIGGLRLDRAVPRAA